jgi:serine/threonine-protein kinase
MALIAGGSFLSGERKIPRTLRPFAIDMTPVTEGDYKKFLTEISATPRSGGPGSRSARYDRHPVTQLTWYEANEFAEHYGKRLPTIYEWEKAARGADGRRFPYGNTHKPGCGKLRANSDSGSDSEKKTAAVGSFPDGASPFGVLDMAGNVLEWTCTARRAGERLFRAAKGACYLDGSPELARCTSVQYIRPECSEAYVGFRCVKDLE